MRNPVPRRYRAPIRNLSLCVLFFFALTGLDAMIDGRAPVPPASLLIGFAFASILAVWLHGLRKNERA